MDSDFHVFYVTGALDALDEVRRRLLAAFADVAQMEAEITKEEWDEWIGPLDEEGMMTGGVSSGKIQEYVWLSTLRQGMLNLMAVQLFHLFEQSYAEYVRRFRLGRTDLPKRWRKFAERLRMGVTESLCLLELTANAVKHGEGDSASELKRRRLDLFGSAAGPHRSIEHVPEEYRHLIRASAPLVGEGLYVTEKHLDEFTAAIRAFWVLASKCSDIVAID